MDRTFSVSSSLSMMIRQLRNRRIVTRKRCYFVGCLLCVFSLRTLKATLSLQRTLTVNETKSPVYLHTNNNISKICLHKAQQEDNIHQDLLAKRYLVDPSTVYQLTQMDAWNENVDANKNGSITRTGISSPQLSPPHFLTTLSGCRMARWILPILGPRPHRRDCYREVEYRLSLEASSPGVLFFFNNDTYSLLRQNDTIYATYDQLIDFVQNVLPYIQVDVVLISGQRENVRRPPDWVYSSVMNHPHILKWFIQNRPKYNPSNPRASTNHGKLAPFPYGLKQLVQQDSNVDDENLLLPRNGKAYRQVFFESLNRSRHQLRLNVVSDDSSISTSTIHGNFTSPLNINETLARIFFGYVNPASNPSARNDDMTGNGGVSVSTPFLPPLEYYRTMASLSLSPLQASLSFSNPPYQYIWSPNGDRPETYRHYEALGLGIAPITQFQIFPKETRDGSSSYCSDSIADDFRHLQDTGVVSYSFGNGDDGDDNQSRGGTNWTDLAMYIKSLERNGRGRQKVNRNAVLEEYWMEYVDATVGRRLQWWNRYGYARTNGVSFHSKMNKSEVPDSLTITIPEVLSQLLERNTSEFDL